MSDLDLVARLRRNPMGLELAAADRIEELEAQLAAQQAQTAPVVPHPAMWSGSLTLTIERLTDDAEMYDRLGHNSTAEDRRARAYELTSLLAALSAAPSAPIQTNSEDAGWISVNKKKPEHGVVVLVAVRSLRYVEQDEGTSEHEFYTVCEGQYTSNEHGGYMEAYQGRIGDFDDITHWMPLPPAPLAATAQKKKEGDQ